MRTTAPVSVKTSEKKALRYHWWPGGRPESSPCCSACRARKRSLPLAAMIPDEIMSYRSAAGLSNTGSPPPRDRWSGVMNRSKSSAYSAGGRGMGAVSHDELPLARGELDAGLGAGVELHEVVFEAIAENHAAGRMVFRALAPGDPVAARPPLSASFVFCGFPQRKSTDRPAAGRGHGRGRSRVTVTAAQRVSASDNRWPALSCRRRSR